MNTAEPSGETPGSGPAEPAGDATVLRMLLGARLRRLREAAGLTPEKAGYEIRASRSKISRMETGRVGLKLRDIEDLLTLYGVADEKQRGQVVALARRSRKPEWWTQYTDVLPGWFETYLSLEPAATTIRSFVTQFVPGLFQTADYARAVTRLGHKSAPEAEIERRVVLDLALPGAGPARRGLRRAAHQRRLPGPARGRGALPGSRRPAQRRGADPRRHGPLHRTGRL